MKASEIIDLLRDNGNEQRAANCAWFFKAGKGGYGEGDVFLGVTVPQTRKIARLFRNASLEERERLLNSKYHEARLLALISLAEAFRKGNEHTRQSIFQLYLRNTGKVNNWDLVDTSAPHIAGAWLWDKDKLPLYSLANSESLWDRRISIIATQSFIKRNHFEDALNISDILLHDREDLIHKAVGWMLREVGNKDRVVEESFLKPRYTKMPRTMLRYAIEKFEPEIRKAYMQGYA